MSKPILCLDFDGVCHSYTSGWKGADIIADGRVDGLKEFLTEVCAVFDIHIFSSRSNQGGIMAMYDWFKEHTGSDIANCLTFPLDKPPAFVTIDDRAICFTGTWPSVEELQNFKPWNKR